MGNPQQDKDKIIDQINKLADDTSDKAATQKALQEIQKEVQSRLSELQTGSRR